MCTIMCICVPFNDILGNHNELFKLKGLQLPLSRKIIVMVQKRFVKAFVLLGNTLKKKTEFSVVFYLHI